MSTENALLTILVDRINNDTLVLPTLPEVALRVRNAADDPDITLHDMADVIANDPALAARMIKVANSALMSRSVKVTTINQAVTRIGLRQIKNIATAMAMEQLFVSQHELIKGYMDKAWQKTIRVACHSIALVQNFRKQQRHDTINTETITLAALTYNIGILPILTEAEKHPEVFANPSFLAHAIQKLAGRIGAAILTAWDFSDEFVEVAKCWADPNYRPKEVEFVDFIRMGAIMEGILQVSDKSSALNVYVDKGIIPSVEIFADDEYQEVVGDIREIFS
ncbi:MULTISPECIES: HDOD domain-containing protein [Pseudoalteromonas]|uniref:HDOD domain-containing protein n=1 Tax=Pseudoalteromonas ruthenica TaxID=151081 RepID=A0A0F4PQZ0_9GAMM|nr:MULTISPECIES: HDOD domain-containing protein [Pseudoalteromonas]KJY97910.1 histidine kinase [Pseudoalteromonas ruthenica]KJZ01936.1 histidine kinase [Pseudoalteromonas ruthenica]MCF2862838.1 HDOD domain-containing protein [Pseudoalteromonas sp. CNAT2-18]MCG7543426.1 HDOD domain-containing protein [Pseudoalteromonas sp. MM17-2]MCG7558710.1 HDOD domain-containing protein [Pseudoalteromonas sp. CNAT2-18.1]|tara:strand:- start:4618 stop:5457 length:840 start_codon:yes stop_codon:yes gene_type:complete